jgi:hypothetical protein
MQDVRMGCCIFDANRQDYAISQLQTGPVLGTSYASLKLAPELGDLKQFHTMNRIIFLITLAFFSINLTGCYWFNKPEDNIPKTPEQMLPAITQKGAGTFGCLVDGQLMLAMNKCQSTFCNSNPYFDPSVGLSMGGYMDTVHNQSRMNFNMEFQYIHGVGRYLLDTVDFRKKTIGPAINSIRFYKNYGLPYRVSTDDSLSYCSGELIITRWDNGIGSGTFWFDLYDPVRRSDTVRVRLGRFDIAW